MPQKKFERCWAKIKKKDTFKPCPEKTNQIKFVAASKLKKPFKGFSTFNQEDLVKMLSKPL